MISLNSIQPTPYIRPLQDRKEESRKRKQSKHSYKKKKIFSCTERVTLTSPGINKQDEPSR